jgi:hypothetical protein
MRHSRHDCPNRPAKFAGNVAVGDGVMALRAVAAPVLEVAGLPLRLAATGHIRLIRPVASPALEVYAKLPDAEEILRTITEVWDRDERKRRLELRA